MRAYLEMGDFSEIVEMNDVESIRITQEVRDRCIENSCGCYGKNYMCPPAVGKLDYFRQQIESYDKGLVFSKTYKINPKKECEEKIKAEKEFRQQVQKIYQEVRKRHKECLFFTAGSCAICRKCAIQDEAPCRYPEDAIPSLEAAGIDVMHLCRRLGMRYDNGSDRVTYFGLLLYHENV